MIDYSIKVDYSNERGEFFSILQPQAKKGKACKKWTIRCEVCDLTKTLATVKVGNYLLQKTSIKKET